MRRGLFAASIVLGLAVAPGTFGGFIYWTETYFEGGASIRRTRFDGSQTQILYWVSSSDTIRGLALDLLDPQIYWAEKGAVRRSDLDGSNVELVYPSGAYSIAVDELADKVYFSGEDEILRANGDGSDLEIVLGGLGPRLKLALDVPAGKLYWLDPSPPRIWRADLDGSSAEQIPIASLANGLTSLAIDGDEGKIYWGGIGTPAAIRRANLDGSEEEVALSGVRVYGSNSVFLGPRALVWAGNDTEGRLGIFASDKTSGIIQQLIADPGSPFINAAQPQLDSPLPPVPASSTVGLIVMVLSLLALAIPLRQCPRGG